MSVLTQQDINEIDGIRTDMEVHGRDIQRQIIVDGKNIGFVTCFGRSRKYHVYIGSGCVAMVNSARALFDYLNKFEDWTLRSIKY